LQEEFMFVNRNYFNAEGSVQESVRSTLSHNFAIGTDLNDLGIGGSVDDWIAQMNKAAGTEDTAGYAQASDADALDLFADMSVDEGDTVSDLVEPCDAAQPCRRTLHNTLPHAWPNCSQEGQRLLQAFYDKGEEYLAARQMFLQHKEEREAKRQRSA
jgi:hypothetical protein